MLLEVNVTTILIVGLICFILAVTFTALILLVQNFCRVKENDKLDKVSSLMSGTNCGGCGFAGCNDFAKALCENKAKLTDCKIIPKENLAKLSSILGVELIKEKRVFSAVNCNGGNNAKNKYDYLGVNSCEYLHKLEGGNKECEFGCLGLGDCVNVCPVNAIKIINGVAVIDKYVCIGCLACVKKCPKHIINPISRRAKVYVKCASTCKGKIVSEQCSNGCFGCGICAKTCPENAIEMRNNLPFIDYEKCVGCYKCVEKCPKGVIQKLDWKWNDKFNYDDNNKLNK